VGDPDAALAAVPPEWDYVVDDQRSRQPAQLEFTGVRAYYQAAHRHFQARLHHGTAGSQPPSYVANQRLQLDLPAELRQQAWDELGDAPIRIAIMPAGSSEPARYPSTASWELIVRALAAEFPDAVFCLVGKLERDARTSTSVAKADFERLAAAAGRRLVWAVDLPLLEQLALVERCSVFVSPHTGFGTAVLAVGTPWLTLSGGPWHEWFFNRVPFYSVIPDVRRYPCFTQLAEQPAAVDDDGPRTPSMTRARIEEDLPELLEGARLLVEGRLGYDEALRRFFPRLLEAYAGDSSRIFSFDGIHHAYI
jgi:hypothetical protein